MKKLGVQDEYHKCGKPISTLQFYFDFSKRNKIMYASWFFKHNLKRKLKVNKSL